MVNLGNYKTVYIVLGINDNSETCLGAFDTFEDASSFNLKELVKKKYKYVITYTVNIDLRSLVN